MQYGHFDDAAREYVITEPQTPSPWINYLGSEAFFHPDEQHQRAVTASIRTRACCA